MRILLLVSAFLGIIERSPVTAQSLTTPLQLSFLNGVFDAYVDANSEKDKRCLDFNLGVQAVRDYLRSKLGSKYNDDYGFCGFQIEMSSTVSRVDDPTIADIQNERTDSIGITAGDEVRNLFEEGPPYFGAPWIVAVDQSRDCHSFIDGVSVHSLEVFNIAVRAFLLPQLAGSKWTVRIESEHRDSRWRILADADGEFQIGQLETIGEFVIGKPVELETYMLEPDTLKVGTGVDGFVEGISLDTLLATTDCEEGRGSWSARWPLGGWVIVTGPSALMLEVGSFHSKRTITSPVLHVNCMDHVEEVGLPFWGHEFDRFRLVGCIEEKHFADAYAMLERVKELWSPSGIRDIDVNGGMEFQFKLRDGEYAYTGLNSGDDHCRGRVKIERKFSKTIYDN